MLNSYYTEKLLGLQEVSIKKICETKEIFEIFIEQPRKQCVCPACGVRTDKIHDYRLQRVKELPAFEKPVVLFCASVGMPAPAGNALLSRTRFCQSINA